jgi:hypothetical protein
VHAPALPLIAVAGGAVPAAVGDAAHRLDAEVGVLVRGVAREPGPGGLDVDAVVCVAMRFVGATRRRR